MRVCSGFMLLLLCSLCSAGDVAPPSPPKVDAHPAKAAPEIFDLTLADGPRLIDHFNASLYAKVWNDPSLNAMREKFNGACTDATAMLGCDPRDLIPAMSTLHLALTGIKLDDLDHPKFQGMAWVSFGDFSTKVMHLISLHAKPATVAGADEALSIDPDNQGNHVLVARFGGQLVATLNLEPKPQAVVVATTADLRMHADVKSLVSIISDGVPADSAAIIKSALSNPNIGNEYSYEATIVPEGILERISQFPAQAVVAVVDRGVLNSLPASTMIALAMAVDGKGLWKTSHDSWMQQYAMTMSKQQNTKVSPQEAEDSINHMLSSINLPITLQQAVEALTGTMVLAIGQGIPFPTATIAMPRSRALDAVVDYALKLINVEMPAEGASTMLPIPNVPISVNLIRDPKHWVLSSDPTITTSWSTGAAGGWTDAPSGKLALSKAPNDSMFIGASDTPAVIHALSGYLGMFMGTMHGASAQENQMLLQALNRLGALATPGYIFSGPMTNPSRTISESRSVVGFIGIPLAAGLIAGKRGMASANTSGSEAAAMAQLRAISVAEVAFKAGAFVDQDANGNGEFGLLTELGGIRPVAPTKTVSLIPHALASGAIDGWRYTVYLPDDKGNVIEEADDKSIVRTKNAKAAPFQEKHWVAYAYPDAGNDSKHMFAILPDGVIRMAPFDDDAPEWSDVFGGGTWDTRPAWQPHH